jgi:hypothetical protein
MNMNLNVNMNININMNMGYFILLIADRVSIVVVIDAAVGCWS